MPGLENKILAITRSEHDAKEFLQLVRGQGGKAIALPAIEIVPQGPEVAEEFLDKLRKKKHYYCAFMSQQAVHVLFDLAHDKIAPVLKSTTVIAVGPKTKQSLEEHGIDVRLVPRKILFIWTSRPLIRDRAGRKKDNHPAKRGCKRFCHRGPNPPWDGS